MGNTVTGLGEQGEWKFDPERVPRQFILGKYIASGGYGTVHECLAMPYPGRYAHAVCKCIYLYRHTKLDGKPALDLNFLQEVKNVAMAAAVGSGPEYFGYFYLDCFDSTRRDQVFTDAPLTRFGCVVMERLAFTLEEARSLMPAYLKAKALELRRQFVYRMNDYWVTNNGAILRDRHEGNIMFTVDPIKLYLIDVDPEYQFTMHDEPSAQTYFRGLAEQLFPSDSDPVVQIAGSSSTTRS